MDASLTVSGCQRRQRLSTPTPRKDRLTKNVIKLARDSVNHFHATSRSHFFSRARNSRGYSRALFSTAFRASQPRERAPRLVAFLLSIRRQLLSPRERPGFAYSRAGAARTGLGDVIGGISLLIDTRDRRASTPGVGTWKPRADSTVN